MFFYVQAVLEVCLFSHHRFCKHDLVYLFMLASVYLTYFCICFVTNYLLCTILCF